MTSIKLASFGLTLDTGALIALERCRKRAWSFMELAVVDGRPVRAPADVLVEFWRGQTLSRQVRTLLDDGIEWIDVTPRLAKRAGEALSSVKQKGPSVVDALVATVAALHGDYVLTGDVNDFAQLTSYYRGLRVVRI